MIIGYDRVMSLSIKKILASDYDGTLRKEGVVDPLDLQAIADFRAQGNWFGIVTGRAYDMIVHELAHYGIQTDFLICNNGSVICDAFGQILSQIDIDHPLALDLVAWLDKEPDVLFGACDGIHYFSQMNGTYEATMKNELIGTIVTSKEFILSQGRITAFFIRKFTDALTDDLIKRLEHDFDHRLGIHPNGGTIDIGPKGISKSSAIKTLQERFPDALITTIGDHLNDMDMVKDFRGYAMALGHDALKKVASRTVDNLREAINDFNQR